MRRGLALLQRESPGEVDPVQVAMLEDRILMYEGKPQRHGTQFTWDDSGQLSPHPVDDPALVDQRRRHLGMEPLATRTAIMRRRAAEEGERPPSDYAAWKRESETWLRRVGWRG